MPNLNDLLLASGNPLQDPMFIMVLIICIILIILSAIIGTILGRKRKAEVEARIAERRKQRRLVQEEAVQREKDMLKRYEDAKKKAEQEMISNPRPLLPVPDIKDEEMRPQPRGQHVELLRTTGPRYMKVQGELGVRGSAPVRLSTRDTVGVQGSRVTDTGEAQSAAKMAKAKPVAGTKPGPPKPAVAVAKPAAVKEEPAVKDGSPTPGPVSQGPPKPVLEAAKKEEEERQRLEKEKAAKKPADEEDGGIDKIQEMLTTLDKMKK
jgi:hypothetical protein